MNFRKLAVKSAYQGNLPSLNLPTIRGPEPLQEYSVSRDAATISIAFQVNENCRKAEFRPLPNPLTPFGKLRTRGEIGLQPEHALQSLHTVVTAVGYHEELDLLAEADGYEVSPERIAQGAGGYASYVEKGVGDGGDDE